MRVTIRDVAKRAGVSIATVSRVLNQSKPVSEKLRRRILQAVEETGYLPNAVARSLIHKRTGLIGVIIPEISNPYFSGLVQGIESVAQKYPYYIMLAVSGKDEERELQLLEIFQSRQMDGIILAAAKWNGRYRDMLSRLQIPHVIIGQRLSDPGIPTAVIDNRRAAFEAVDHLIRLGHRRIGMIRGPQWDLASGKERFEGYRLALKKSGLAFRSEWAPEQENFHIRDGYRGMESIHGAKEMPTAVFCACDRMAVGAMQYLDERGIRVPEEVSVVGFDDEELARIVKPRLTTVRHLPFDMGSKAATLLTEMLLDDEATPSCVVLEHELIVRESTAEPKEKDGC